MTSNYATLRQYMVDACIAVKLVLKSEPGHSETNEFYRNSSSIEMTPHCITEAFGVLKRKWLSKNAADKISDEQYHKAAYVLNAILKEKVTVSGDSLTDSQTLFEATKLSKKYNIDVLDCLQLMAAKKMQARGWVGESAPVFVTADAMLKDAAVKEGVKCWSIEEACEFERQNMVKRITPLS